MPTKTKPKQPPKVAALQQEVVNVPLGKLKPYRKNPRRGNVDAIAESLFATGQFRPILVQQSTMEILAGNHTWRGAQKLNDIATGKEGKPTWLVRAEGKLNRGVVPWPTIAVVYIDCDDKTAERIVIADNRTSDLGGYDAQVLRELLDDIGDSTGTGYSDRELNLIIGTGDEAAADMAKVFAKMEKDTEPKFDVTTLLRGMDEEEVPQMDDGSLQVKKKGPIREPEPFSESEDELPGIIQLDDEKQLPRVGQWDFPPLRQDMMIEELPEQLEAWAGSATRDLDYDGHWLYNYGVDSTSGMKDVSKVVLAFYCWDEYFDTWWWNLGTLTTKVINSGIKQAIYPNFTQGGGMPRAEALYQMYKSKHIGRFLQEAGIQVMPDLECVHEPTFLQIMRETTPKRLPWASIQVQNLVGASETGKGATKDDVDKWKHEMLELYELMKPENLLVYGNDNGFQMFDDLKLKCGKKYVVTRVAKLSEKAKGRKKKTTL